jgi:hypothetical protein
MSEIMMRLKYQLLSLIPLRFHSRTISLIGREREGGYTFITSPQMPGFSFMLKPGEAEDVRAFINAIEPALMAYIAALSMSEAGSRQRQPSERQRLAGIRRMDHKNYIAELCPA